MKTIIELGIDREARYDMPDEVYEMVLNYFKLAPYLYGKSSRNMRHFLKVMPPNITILVKRVYDRKPEPKKTNAELYSVPIYYDEVAAVDDGLFKRLLLTKKN